jgi:hypothetical protein
MNWLLVGVSYRNNYSLDRRAPADSDASAVADARAAKREPLVIKPITPHRPASLACRFSPDA